MFGPTTALTEEQIAFYRNNGYLSLGAITTQYEVGQLRVIYDRLFSDKAGWEEGNQFDLAGTDENDRPVLPQLLNPSRYAPELLKTQYRRNAKAIAHQLLGDEMSPHNGEHMIYKPPGIGAVTPWHQDQAYHDPTTISRGINVWMPLDDVTVESGCLHFVPGSHTMDVLPHHSIGQEPRIHGLEVDDPEEWASRGVPCPIPAGGATLHAAYMLHYAAANTTHQPRRAYTLTFRLPAIKRDIPIDNYWSRVKRTARAERARTSNASPTGRSN